MGIADKEHMSPTMPVYERTPVYDGSWHLHTKDGLNGWLVVVVWLDKHVSRTV